MEEENHIKTNVNVESIKMWGAHINTRSFKETDFAFWPGIDECTFDSKEKEFFEDDAVENHLSEFLQNKSQEKEKKACKKWSGMQANIKTKKIKYLLKVLKQYKCDYKCCNIIIHNQARLNE